MGAAAATLIAACGSRTGLPFEAPSDAGADATVSVPCRPGEVTLSRANPSVMLVLDRSGSMGDALLRGTPGQNRWEILTAALGNALPPVDSSMAIGALFFPAGSGRGVTCGVTGSTSISPAIGQVQTILDRMRSNVPGGGTPTADAIDVAAGLLAAVRAASTARAMILATDGEPNCNASLSPTTCTCVESTSGCRFNANQCLDDVRTVDRIASHAQKGLPTYVIGIEDAGDARFADVLDRMAEAGGRPQVGAAHKYYSGNSEAELEDALVVIRNQVGACTYLTTSVPDARGAIVVTLDGATLPFDPSGTTGWTWSDRNNGEIILAGGACTAVAGEPTPALVAQVTCGDAPDAGGD